MPQKPGATNPTRSRSIAEVGLISSGPQPAASASSQSNLGVDTSADSQVPLSSDSLAPTSSQSTVYFDSHIAKQTLQPGDHLGRYRLESVLGSGGMGIVWLGYDPRLNRSVAIKTLRPGATAHPAIVASFLVEGQRLASLSHPDIIPVYDCGNDGGICYLVSEYVSQGTLADKLQRDALSYSQAVDLVAHVADAAHYAHVRGLVHRDIKPANILMRDDGKPLLADFGLAIAEEEQLLEDSGTLGTYGYMAPEQMLGESRFVDSRADIYSLGVVLYQLLTGRLPYVANTIGDYRALVANRDPRPPRTIRPDIPPALEAVCLKCLARRPNDRYTTAADLSAALRPQPTAHVGWHRNGLGVVVAAVVLAATIVGGAALLNGARLQHSGSEEKAATPLVPPSSGNADVDESPTAASTKAAAGSTAAVSADGGLSVDELSIGDGATAKWGFDGNEAIWFLSSDLCLLKLGEHQQGDLDFSVELEQQNWTGHIGVFWGLKSAPQRAGWETLETFQLYPRNSDELRLRNSLLTFARLRPNLSRDVELAYWNLDAPPQRRQRIGFTLRDDHLASLQWGESDLDDVVAEQGKNLPPGSTTSGAFGLFNVHSHGVYRAPIVNGKRLHFASRPAVVQPK